MAEHEINSVPDTSSPRRSKALFLSIAALTLATPLLSWAAIGDRGDHHEGPNGTDIRDYSYGPYHLNVRVEYAVGIAAAIMTIGAVVVLAQQAAHHEVPRRTWVGIALLMSPGIVGAWAWRILTTGYYGAPIGEQAVPVFSALVIGSLLWCAINMLSDPGARQRRVAWRSGAIAVATVVLVLPFTLL